MMPLPQLLAMQDCRMCSMKGAGLTIRHMHHTVIACNPDEYIISPLSIRAGIKHRRIDAKSERVMHLKGNGKYTHMIEILKGD